MIESNAAYIRRLRAEAVAKGLCQQCRMRQAKQDCVTCQHCLDANRDRRLAYRGVDLCNCGRKPTPGLVTCKWCRERVAVWGVEHREQRVVKGICLMCPDAAATDRKLCLKHLASRSAAALERRRSFIAIGICGQCQQADLESETLCIGCLGKMRRYEQRRKRNGVTRRNYSHVGAKP